MREKGFIRQLFNCIVDVFKKTRAEEQVLDIVDHRYCNKNLEIPEPLRGEDAVDYLYRISGGDVKLAAEAYWLENDEDIVSLESMALYVLNRLEQRKNKSREVNVSGEVDGLNTQALDKEDGWKKLEQRYGF